MFEWDGLLEKILEIGALLSFLVFLGSFVVIPVLIARLPQDYFLQQKDAHSKKDRDSIGSIFYLLIKNVAGIFLFLCGIAMLLLPGQGLLSMLIGLSLISFPGKRTMVRGIARRRSIFKALNWIRRKVKQPPLVAPRQ